MDLPPNPNIPPSNAGQPLPHSPVQAPSRTPGPVDSPPDAVARTITFLERVTQTYSQVGQTLANQTPELRSVLVIFDWNDGIDGTTALWLDKNGAIQPENLPATRGMFARLMLTMSRLFSLQSQAQAKHDTTIAEFIRTRERQFQELQNQLNSQAGQNPHVGEELPKQPVEGSVDPGGFV